MTAWDGAGWHRQAQRAPSPHHDERPVSTVVDLLVVHAISLPPERFGSGDVQRFFMGTLDFSSYPYYGALRDLHVSAHFFIERDGSLWQHVGVFQRAWHAGASAWQGAQPVTIIVSASSWRAVKVLHSCRSSISVWRHWRKTCRAYSRA